jgi:LysR family transcriptional regulator, benzoate and cis,cis-muconate-responsive activator of ben and cat genes
MLPGVRIDDIETALKVVECKHFGRAGDKCNREQSTVTKGLQRVERHAGARLLDRSAHRPTPAGVSFFYYARKGIDCFQRAFAELHRSDGPDHTLLQVGYTTYLDLDLLAYVENVTRSSQPGFAHSRHSSSSAEIVENVRSGAWDCGFIVSPTAEHGLASVPVCQDPLGLVLAHRHPLACKRKMRIRDLGETPLILPSKDRNPGFRAWLTERCGAEGVTPQIAEEVSNPLEACFFAAQQKGAALMPRSSARGLLKGSAGFRPFAEDDLYIEIQLVFRDERRSRPLAAFVEAVVHMRERIERGALRFAAVRASQLSPAHTALRRSPTAGANGHTLPV